MYYPNLSEEKKLWRRGLKKVAGLDEAGRGPLAGPVVAGAVCAKPGLPQIKLRDSKQLSAKQREYFYKILTSHKGIRWGIGIVSEKIIDKINILEATKLAMAKAIKKLKTDYLILDGNFKINSSVPQKSIIKGDQKVFSCAAASILAKVTRDRMMLKYHKKFPKYRFDLHKGYPTKIHIKMLKKYGPCNIHRESFGPVASLTNFKY
ncbi:MAG: ribonuclease HII [Candidatus Nealsonbacteria bacterium RIFCSPLOWO2_01_FULL_41_9]|uniref:Ribonuclease HII n=1 Tax=Candidatus Nealsonbacteria bacterium RIFCSPLOWO2_01_FULL_41_9 TaxID=1801671 RepID=A0A1G2EAI0_9BACT|nr:MAG: ribonuclease HII [Candidatus Nealsonbacteria bacterium RIFCSPLOWO2_01_FULL_41_9]